MIVVPMCWKLSFSRRYPFLSDGKEDVFRKLLYLLECKMRFCHEIWRLSMWGCLKSCTKHQIRWLCTGPCPVKPRPASPNHHMRYALLWDNTWHRAVICYLCCGTTHQYHLQRSRNPKERTEHNGKFTDTLFFFGEAWSIVQMFKEAGYFGSRLCYLLLAKNPSNLVYSWTEIFLTTAHHRHNNWLRYAPENKSSPRVVTGIWLNICGSVHHA